MWQFCIKMLTCKENKRAVGGKRPTASSFQMKRLCAVVMFPCEVLLMLDQGLSRACLCDRSRWPGDTMREQGPMVCGGRGSWALLTPLLGMGDNKSIDCPSPVGAKCKQIEKEREQNRLVIETDKLNRGAAACEMSLWPLPSSFHYDVSHDDMR